MSEDAFDAIYKIEDNGIEREPLVWFVWRAAFLGAVVFAVVEVFWITLAFMVGDRFYTKTDVTKCLGLPVVGLLYGSRNDKEGKQERRLIEAIKELLENYKKIYFLDGTDGQDVECFLRRFSELDTDVDCESMFPCEQYHTGEHAVILVIVPFGKVYREKITDEINNAVMHGGTIAGAILTECDKSWVGMYYGKGVKA